MRIGGTIYLDHQATTPVDPRVFEKMKPFFYNEFGNPHSSEHAIGWKAAKTVEAAKIQVARLIGADPDEIIFTSGATEANNLGLLGLARKNQRKRHRILVSEIEHKSVIESALAMEKLYNFRVESIPVDKFGSIDINLLKAMISDDVLLVSIMAVNNEIGTIQNIDEIGRIANKSGVIFHCDSSQAPCAIDINVYKQNIDLLSLSSHKIYGPKGIGSLYIRRSLQSQIEPLFYGGSQQNGLRPGTIPSELCVGFGAAAELLQENQVQEDRSYLRRLRDRFVEDLCKSEFPIEENGPPSGYRHPGNTNLRFGGFSAHEILASLQPRLSASTGSACTSGMLEPSYVLKAIGLSKEEANSSIRFSFGRYSTEEDVENAVSLIKNALESLS